MSMTFELGISSVDAITIRPEYDYTADIVKIENRSRAKSGKLFTYLWSVYRRFEFSTRYMDASNADLVNSWWASDAELLFFATEDLTTQVFSVVLANNSVPMDKYMEPGIDYKQGKILLEGY